MVEKIGDRYSIRVETEVAASAGEAWSCFMDPEKSAEFFFGISFKSDLKVGSPIIWEGEWEGARFIDRGKILELEENRLFRYDYFSSFSGEPDLPENHYEVEYRFEPDGDRVRVAISQKYAKSREAAEHSEKNWSGMLEALKRKLEAPRAARCS